MIHNGAPFSTIDNDNDNFSENCAIVYMGAWWYTSCHTSNLNGHNYGTSDQTPYGTGVIWYSFTTHNQTLKWDIMAIRPTNANLKKMNKSLSILWPVSKFKFLLMTMV